MKSKRLAVIFISFILSCAAAYAVGQKVVLPLSHRGCLLYTSDAADE